MSPIWAAPAPEQRQPPVPLRRWPPGCLCPPDRPLRWGLLLLALLGLTPMAAVSAAPLPSPPAGTAAVSQTAGPGTQGDQRPRAQRTDPTSPSTQVAPATAALDTPPPQGKQQPTRISEAVFQDRLRRDDLDGLDDLCRLSASAGETERLAQLRQRLLDRPMLPVSLAKILATADVLLSCQAPAAALTVLDRISPNRGSGRVQWLLLQWRAANANLDHRLAARALERLSGGQGERLAALELALTRPASGRGTASSSLPAGRRAAVDVLADHLEARGRPALAAERLLAAARLPVPAGDTPALILQAERLHRAVTLLSDLPAAERERLLEPALEQAAAVGAWGMVLEMLDDQIRLKSQRALERRMRLSPRLDDAYGEWRLREQAPGDGLRLKALDQRLRSPREPGGHAAEPAGASASPAPNGVHTAPPAGAPPAKATTAAPATPARDTPAAPGLPISPRPAMP